jgi:hypothetical protein
MFLNYLKKTPTRAEIQESQDTEPFQNQPLHKDLSMNLETIQTEMGHSKDVITRKFLIAGTIEFLPALLLVIAKIRKKQLNTDYREECYD